jgi:hypothetical protein
MVPHLSIAPKDSKNGMIKWAIQELTINPLNPLHSTVSKQF